MGTCTGAYGPVRQGTSMSRDKRIDVVCVGCGEFFKRKLSYLVHNNYCTWDCFVESNKSFRGGAIVAFFEGKKVNQRRFTNRYRLKKILALWSDLYAGGELSIMFDES